MNIYIYIHIAAINNYRDIFKMLIHRIRDSGLYNIVKEIRCGILNTGDYDKSIFEDPKIIVRGISNDLSLYEKFTINMLQYDAKNEDFKVLYLHTKGVTKPGNPYIQSWVDYLCYFNIYQHETCSNLLTVYDTVGVNICKPPGPCHYSGNFWWSKSNYINRLEPCTNKTYNAPEFWLCEKYIGKYACLWQSNINHYHSMYPIQEYLNKPIIPQIYNHSV